jgi:uncharacterized protein YbjT (DUF2867 family)
MTIAITTPTGHVGSRVVQLLVQAGVRPTVLVRDPAKLDDGLRDLVEVAQGDLTDRDFVQSATRGIDSLLWVVPESFTAEDPLGDMTRLASTAADVVDANGIARVVLISSVGAEKKHGAGLIDGLARNEEALTATESNVFILRCGNFFTNLLGNIDELRNGTLTVNMPGDRPMPWVDPRDIGEVAAARLLASDWTGDEIQAVHGPADLTWTEVAATISRVTGLSIDLQVVSDDDVRAAMGKAGMPAGAVEGMVGMTAGLREGFTPEQPRTWLSTTPTTLESWVAGVLRYTLV